jgi:hypothetical protein
MAAGAMTLVAARLKAQENALRTEEVWFVITFNGGFAVTDLDGLTVRSGFSGGCTVVGVMDPAVLMAMAEAEMDARVNEP